MFVIHMYLVILIPGKQAPGPGRGAGPQGSHVALPAPDPVAIPRGLRCLGLPVQRAQERRLRAVAALVVRGVAQPPDARRGGLAAGLHN